MALNNKLNQVKDELIHDQSLLVQAFKLESFFRKYRVLIIAFGVILLALIAYFVISNYNEGKKNAEASLLFNEIVLKNQNKQDTKDLEDKLKALNPVLYDYYIFNFLANLSYDALMQKENLDKLESISNSKDEYIKQMASYTLASLKQDLDGLSKAAEYSFLNNNMKNLIYMQLAYIYIQNNNIKKAQDTLLKTTSDGINADVRFNSFISHLKHYGVASNPLAVKK